MYISKLECRKYIVTIRTVLVIQHSCLTERNMLVFYREGSNQRLKRHDAKDKNHDKKAIAEDI